MLRSRELIGLTLFFAACARVAPPPGPNGLMTSAALASELLLSRPLPKAEEIALRERLASVISSEAPALPQDLARSIAEAIVDEAPPLGLEPSLVLGMISVESGFNPEAISPMGAAGLMQLMQPTRDWLLGREADLSRSDEPPVVRDVRLGVRYYAFLLRIFRRHERALAAYNVGPNKLLELAKKGRPPPVETSRYPGKVLAAHRRFAQALGPTKISPILAGF